MKTENNSRKLSDFLLPDQIEILERELQSYANKCVREAIQRSDNFRINIISELSRKELEERCIEMYEKIEAMKWNFANKEDDYGMEIKRLTDQPSILEEVKRLRDEHEKIFNTPSSETLSLECELRYYFIKELNEIINKYQS